MDTCLEQVVFTMYEDRNSGHNWHNPRGNMEPFRDVFGLEHQHARFAASTRPAALDANRPAPQGA
eukprot:2454-Alexandrium_andersonii.AAC.1